MNTNLAHEEAAMVEGVVTNIYTLPTVIKETPKIRTSRGTWL